MEQKLSKQNDLSDVLSSKFYRPLSDWLAKKLQKTSITPNQITLIGFVITIFASYLFFINKSILAAI